jgi:hypothetical protein
VEYLDSRYPNRENYCKGVSLALISSVAGNSVRTAIKVPVQTYANIYVLLCGDTNSGKTTISKYGMDILDQIQYRNILTDDTTTEAMPAYFKAHPYALMRISEFTKVIGSYKKKAYMSGMREALVRAFDGETLTQLRAGKPTEEVRGYAMVFLADTQPQVISEEATESDVQSGFFPRINWFHQTDPSKVPLRATTNMALQMRDELIQRYIRLYKTILKYEIHFIISNEQLEQISSRLEPYQKTEQHQFQGFFDRVRLFAFKYAMLYEIAEPEFLDNFPNTNNDEEEVSWTSDTGLGNTRKQRELPVSNAAIGWTIEFLQDYIEHSLPQTLKILKLSDADKIIDTIEQYWKRHTAPMPESLLYRAVVHTFKDAGRIENAIKLATKMNMVAKEPIQGGYRYWLFDHYMPKKVTDFDQEPDPHQPEPEDDDS